MSNKDENKSTAVERLLGAIQGDLETIARKRSEINEVKKHFTTIQPATVVEEGTSETGQRVYVPDERFDALVDYYLPLYREIGRDNIDDLELIIPDITVYRYRDVIYRLIAESYREINGLLKTEAEANAKGFFEEEIALEQAKIEKLRLLLAEDELEETVELEEDNKTKYLYLVPNESGNNPVLDELGRISPDYYPGFYNLFYCLLTGSTTKQINTQLTKGPIKSRKLVNDKYLDGFYLLMGYKTRILYRQIGPDTIAIVSVYTQNTDQSVAQRRTLHTKAERFDIRLIRKQIEENNLDRNEKYLQKIWRKLSENPLVKEALAREDCKIKIKRVGE